MSKFDVAEIKRLCPITALLARYNWPGKLEGSHTYRGPCPLHKGVGARSRTFAITGEWWYCHKCKVGGDVISLLQRLLRVPFQVAALEVCRLCGVQAPHVPAPENAGTEKRNGRGDRGRKPPEPPNTKPLF